MLAMKNIGKKRTIMVKPLWSSTEFGNTQFQTIMVGLMATDGFETNTTMFFMSGSAAYQVF